MKTLVKRSLVIERESFARIQDILPNTQEPLIIAGPCSLESEELLDETARGLSRLGIKVMQASINRTKAYSEIQNVNKEEIQIWSKTLKQYGMYCISEIMDIRHLDYMIDKIDILQIGSRSMHNYRLLKEIGKSKYPVLLKRGMSTTLEEFVQTAEYIASEGNRKIILCERGIRNFDSLDRNSLDINCIPIVHMQTKLPMIVDISNSADKEIVGILIRAVKAVGADGIMLEVNPHSAEILSK